MSDKFFFKGRQDSRQHHTKLGYQTHPEHKAGSKKYPLTLVVTSEERRQAVAALAADAQVHADIALDSSEGAVESIAELTAILNKGKPVTLDKTPSRNDPCSCGSGKKYKKCCG